MIGIGLIIVSVKVTLLLTILHIFTELCVRSSQQKIKLIFDNLSHFDNIQDCRMLLRNKFEEQHIGSLEAVAVLVCLILKALSIVSFCLTLAFYFLFYVQ